MLKSNYLLALFLSMAVYAAKAQSSKLNVGLRLQKDIGLYTENGIAVDYSNKNLKPDNLYFGFSFVTSSLGTAVSSNAIKQNNYLLSAAWYFRKTQLIRPFLRANTGYFYAGYPDLFSVLPHSSLLLSTDGGLRIQTRSPFSATASLGYNLIYGQGTNNVPGTLYPLYYQITLSWNILK